MFWLVDFQVCACNVVICGVHFCLWDKHIYMYKESFVILETLNHISTTPFI